MTMTTRKWPSVRSENYAWTNRYGVPEKIQTAVMPPIVKATPTLSIETIALLDKATAAAVRFDEYAHAKLGDDALRLMAVTDSIGSSEIENIRVTPEELHVARTSGRHNDSTTLVEQNRELTEIAFLTRQAPTVDTVKAFHSTLLNGVDSHAGDIRETISWIGGGWFGPNHAVFVPPKPERVSDSLDDLIEFMRRDDIPSLLHSALAHAHYEGIHPFSDGNGRTGRALVHAMLGNAGISTRTVVPFSTFINDSRRDYYDALSGYRQGLIEPIVKVFATAVLRASEWGCWTVDEIASFQHRMKSLNTSRSDSAATRLIDLMVGLPAVTTSTVSTALDIPATSARSAIESLEGRGLLTEVTGNKRRRVWVARDITDRLHTRRSQAV